MCRTTFFIESFAVICFLISLSLCLKRDLQNIFKRRAQEQNKIINQLDTKNQGLNTDIDFVASYNPPQGLYDATAGQIQPWRNLIQLVNVGLWQHLPGPGGCREKQWWWQTGPSPHPPAHLSDSSWVIPAHNLKWLLTTDLPDSLQSSFTLLIIMVLFPFERSWSSTNQSNFSSVISLSATSGNFTLLQLHSSADCF